MRCVVCGASDAACVGPSTPPADPAAPPPRDPATEEVPMRAKSSPRSADKSVRKRLVADKARAHTADKDR